MRMPMTAPLLYLCALAATLPGTALGMEAPLTLDMAVQRALANSRELTADKEELKGLQNAADRVPLLANPVLELEGKTGALTGSPDDRGISITVLQEIPLAAVGSKRRSVARAEADLARLKINERTLKFGDEVRRSWVACAVEQQRLELVQAQMEIAGRLLSIANERFKAGDLAELEVRLADLDLRKQQLRLTEQQTVLAMARRQLARLLGLSGVQELPQLAVTPAPRTALPDDEQLLLQALQQRSDLVVLHQETERDRSALELARAEALPSLTVGLSYSNERSSQNAYDLAAGQLLQRNERTNDHILGLKLSIPLPLFSRNQAELARATGRVSAGNARTEALKRTAEVEIKDLLAHYRLAQSAWELHRATLGPAARENLNIQQQAFALGEVGMQIVLDEKRRLAEQQEAELKALQLALETYSRLEVATGGTPAISGGTP